MKIKGKAYYCFTTKKNTKGQYPSNCYEIGILDPEVPDTLAGYVKTRETEVDGATVIENFIKISNSKYEFPMFDMEANRLDHSVAIPNGTEITVEVDVKHNNVYDTDYLIVKAVQINEEIKEYNPFK